jgi:ribonuclease HI
MSSFIIYTDGACRGNPGPGGWATVIYDVQNNHIFELGAHAKHTTNNRMELEAARHALESISAKSGVITMYVDSTYVIQGITEWVPGWQRRGWVTANGSPVVNRDLWEHLWARVQVLKKHCSLEWKHILGHAGIPGNERADEIAQNFADQKSVSLYDGSSKDYALNLVDIPEAKPNASKASKKRSGKTAYSYLSLVDGVLQKHKTWDECSARVQGVRNAKYKKALSAD